MPTIGDLIAVARDFLRALAEILLARASAARAAPGAAAAGRRRGADDRRGLAATLIRRSPSGDLDLGQLIVGQQLGELAHQRRIDAHVAIFRALGGWAMAYSHDSPY